MINLAAADYLSAVASVASTLTYTLFGMELDNTTKAETYKVLAQGQVAASHTTVYTSPAGTTAFVKHIAVVNTDTAARTFQISRGGTAASNRITPTIEIPAGGLATYEDGLGWTVYNDKGQALIASPFVPFTAFNKKVLSGALYETRDRDLCEEVNSAVLSTGRLSLQAIYIPAGVTITSISFWSATTAASIPTNQLFGLYDNNLNYLRASNNDTTTAWAATAKKALNLTSSFTTAYSGLYYLAIMVTAATVPTLKGNTAKTGGQLGGGAPSMGGTSNTGLTTSLPTTANAPGLVTTSFWGCVN